MRKRTTATCRGHILYRVQVDQFRDKGIDKPKLRELIGRGKLKWNFRHAIFIQIVAIDGWGISCEIALIWVSLDFTDDQSTLVQVITWANVDPDLCRHMASLSHNELISVSKSPCQASVKSCRSERNKHRISLTGDVTHLFQQSLTKWFTMVRTKPLSELYWVLPSELNIPKYATK